MPRDRPSRFRREWVMKSIIIWLEFAGLLLGLVALIKSSALTIFLFMSLGNLFILLGLVLYVILVLKDLKRHKVL